MSAVVEQASAVDAAPAARCLASAFAADPLMRFFFGDHPAGRDVATEWFFSILLRLRVTLGMPAFVARDGRGVVGAVMGYSTVRPEWPMSFRREWEEFEASAPEIPQRFSIYDGLSKDTLPKDPHYYLGVIGVTPQARGTGAGSALMRAYCDRSARDPLSAGVYLETANPDNLGFYGRHGFEVRGEGPLGPGRLWCLFHPHER